MNIVLGINDGSIRIWELLNNDIMINHLEFRSNRKLTLLDDIKSKGIRIWVDSGGYQIMMKNLSIGLDELVRRYKLIHADYYMSLDRPVFEKIDNLGEIIRLNVRNFEYLYEKLDDKLIIPVVHLYPGDLLLETIEKYLAYNPPFIAYGGIVPPVLRKSRYRLKSLLGAIIIKKAFPNVKLHVLGIGSHIMIYMLDKLGVDSIDTSTWRVKAAFGHIILPHNGERYVGNRSIRFRTPKISDEELEYLRKMLEDTGFPFIDDFDSLLQTFRGRAIINAWIIAKIGPGISEKSPFFKLYKKLEDFNANYGLEDLLRIYDGDMDGKKKGR